MNYPYSNPQNNLLPIYQSSGVGIPFLSKVREFLKREEAFPETLKWELVRLCLKSYKASRMISWGDLKRVLSQDLRLSSLIGDSLMDDYEITLVAKRARDMRFAKNSLERLIDNMGSESEITTPLINTKVLGFTLWKALLEHRLSPMARSELIGLCASQGIITEEERKVLGKITAGHSKCFKTVCEVILRHEGLLKGMLSIVDLLSLNPKKGWVKALYEIKSLEKAVGTSIETSSSIIYKRGWVILGEVCKKEEPYGSAPIWNTEQGVYLGIVSRVYSDNLGDRSVTAIEAILEEYKRQVNKMASIYGGRVKRGPGYTNGSNQKRRSLRNASTEEIYEALRLYRRSQGQNTQVCLRLAQEKGYLKSWIQLLYVIGKEDINKGRNHIFFAVAMTQRLEGKYLRMGMKALKEARDQGIEEAGVRYDILRRQALGGSQRLKGIFG